VRQDVKVRFDDVRSRSAEMSTLNHAHNRRTADGPVPAATIAGYIDGAGVYLTDEVFLYRVVGLAASGLAETVELEDCYRLDVVQVPVRDLRARRLRVVTPAPVEG
jgi:hypothetical protein